MATRTPGDHEAVGAEIPRLGGNIVGIYTKTYISFDWGFNFIYGSEFNVQIFLFDYI